MSDFPDAPEAVALALFHDIEAAERQEDRRRNRNRSTRADLLDLYAECLTAVVGQRKVAEHALHRTCPSHL
jgi:hypothetical protein